MDILKKLPQEIQDKIFYMVLQHPLATIFKNHIKIKRCIACTHPYDIIQEYMVITDSNNRIEEFRHRAIEIYTCDSKERSEIIERQIRAYNLIFISKYHKTSFIYDGMTNGIITD